jgi:hypothetical protein
MKKLTTMGALAVVGTFTLAIGLAPARAANPTPAPGATSPGITASGKKFSFTANDVNQARRMTAAKPQIMLSWETRVRMANNALAQDGATLKKTVDDVLARADQKAADCSGKNYTLADLQNLCQPNEGVQACLDRLRWNCVVGQAAQQNANALANAFAASTAMSVIGRMRNELTALEKALFQQ